MSRSQVALKPAFVPSWRSNYKSYYRHTSIKGDDDNNPCDRADFKPVFQTEDLQIHDEESNLDEQHGWRRSYRFDV